MKTMLCAAAVSCVCLTGCGPDERTGAAVPSVSTTVMTCAESTQAAVPSDGPVVSHAARRIEPALDSALKVMDDFSAALGAQYARFSYDTNRLLTAQHTNFLLSCSIPEYADFMRDFVNTRLEAKSISSDEYALIKAVAAQRILEIAAGDGDEKTWLLEIVNPMLRITAVAEDYEQIASLYLVLLRPEVLNAMEGRTYYSTLGSVTLLALDLYHMAPNSVCEQQMPALADALLGVVKNTSFQNVGRKAQLSLTYMLCMAESWYAPKQALSTITPVLTELKSAYPYLDVRFQAFYDGLIAGKSAGELEDYTGKIEHESILRKLGYNPFEKQR